MALINKKQSGRRPNTLTNLLTEALSLDAPVCVAIMMEGIKTGKITFSEDRTFLLSQKVWFDLLKYVIDRCEGTPVQMMNIEEDSGIIRPLIVLPGKDTDNDDNDE